MLSECAIYMTIINKKSVKENYTSLKKQVLKEGVNPMIVKKLLLNEIKARANDPDRIKKLYRKLSYRLNNLSKKKDPALEHMVVMLLNDESDVEKRIVEIVNYLQQNGGLKSSKVDDIIDQCLEIYDSAISKGHNHQEAVLRSLLSIPFKLVTNLNGMKLLKYGALILVIGVFGELMWSAFVLKSVGIVVLQLISLLVTFILIKVFHLSSFIKTVWRS